MNCKSLHKPGTQIKEDSKSIHISTIDFDMLLFKDLYEELWSHCRQNNLKELKLLLSTTNLNLETKTVEGWNALIIATYNGAFECIEFLLAQGVNVNAENYNKTTVLMYAKSNALKTQKLDSIKLLLEYKADINKQDVFQKTVLDWVIEENLELYNFFKSRL